MDEVTKDLYLALHDLCEMFLGIGVIDDADFFKKAMNATDDPDERIMWGKVRAAMLKAQAQKS